MFERYGLNELTEDDFKEIVATYYGMVTRVDDQFGQIIDKLKALHMYDNTAILFFSDHGDYVGDYGLTEKWPNALQDCLVNVPLILKIPKVSPTKKNYSDLVQTIDIFPTIADIAQVETPYTHFGKSLIPLLTKEGIEHRKAVFSEAGYNIHEPQCFELEVKDPNDPHLGIYYEKTNLPKTNRTLVSRATMIRTEDWKHILRNEEIEELYHLKMDPYELQNLIDDEESSLKLLELREQLLRWYLDTSDNPNYKRLRLV
jgi:arylsulfatase A-like enzyme